MNMKQLQLIQPQTNPTLCKCPTNYSTGTHKKQPTGFRKSHISIQHSSSDQHPQPHKSSSSAHIRKKATSSRRKQLTLSSSPYGILVPSSSKDSISTQCHSHPLQQHLQINLSNNNHNHASSIVRQTKLSHLLGGSSSSDSYAQPTIRATSSSSSSSKSSSNASCSTSCFRNENVHAHLDSIMTSTKKTTTTSTTMTMANYPLPQPPPPLYVSKAGASLPIVSMMSPRSLKHLKRIPKLDPDKDVETIRILHQHLQRVNHDITTTTNNKEENHVHLFENECTKPNCEIMKADNNTNHRDAMVTMCWKDGCTTLTQTHHSPQQLPPSPSPSSTSPTHKKYSGTVLHSQKIFFSQWRRQTPTYASIVLQCHIRKHQAHQEYHHRKHIRQIRLKREYHAKQQQQYHRQYVALWLQSHSRRILAHIYFITVKQKYQQAQIIQRAWRCISSKRLLLFYQQIFKNQTSAVILLQCWIRTRMAVQMYQWLSQIQKVEHTYQQRLHYLYNHHKIHHETFQRLGAAMQIQTLCKIRHAYRTNQRLLTLARRGQQMEAISNIQTWIRRAKHHQLLVQKIQMYCHHMRVVQPSAIVLIQSWMRQCRSKDKVNQMRDLRQKAYYLRQYEKQHALQISSSSSNLIMISFPRVEKTMHINIKPLHMSRRVIMYTCHIQMTYQMKQWLRRTSRIINPFHTQKEERCARLCQQVYRGYRARKRMKRYKRQQQRQKNDAKYRPNGRDYKSSLHITTIQACIIIQRHMRGYRVRKIPMDKLLRQEKKLSKFNASFVVIKVDETLNDIKHIMYLPPSFNIIGNNFYII